MAAIVSDEEVFSQFTEDSRKAYRRAWSLFVEFSPDCDFEAGPPGEEVLSKYFKHLRLEKKAASSTLWTLYSYINSVMKRKYGARLQQFPRLTLLIKSYQEDVKNKAAIFDDALIKGFMARQMENAYWLVRQAICIVAFFGGLRLQECLDLSLEKIQRSKDGFIVTHSRVKQRRSDRLETRFLVPDVGGFAGQLGLYLEKVNNQLKKYQGRVWYTGTQSEMFRNQPMGKNMVSRLPHEIATLLSLPDPAAYTFHSFRRTSASSAADGGSTSAQMTDFFGWKNPNMCQEYVSTSKPAITNMAMKLAGDVETFDMDEPEVEVEVEVVQETDNETLKDESDEFLFMLEEDPEMYAAAGLPLPTPTSSTTLTSTSTCTSSPVDIQATVQNVMSSVQAMQGANVNIKVVVVTGNNSTMNF